MVKEEILNKKIAVVGAGAIGLFYGSRLSLSDFKVQFQSRSNAKKVKINSIWGDFSIEPDLYKSTKEMSPADILILSTKALPDIDHKNLLDPIMKKNTILICLQNGIDQEEKLKRMFPESPILGGLAFTCIYREGYRKIHHIDHGHIKIAPLEVKNMQIVDMIAKIFLKSGIQCTTDRNLRKLRWEKLLWNIPFNPLSIILKGANTREMTGSPYSLYLVRAMMEETRKIALSEKIRITHMQIAEMIDRTSKMKPYKTSMLLDYEQKRKLEVEAILGEPLKIARKKNIKTPVLNTIYQILTHLNNN